jgi:two-component system, chemotaxis family, sensor kinase CheA
MSKIPDSALNEFYAECEEILQRVSNDLSQIEKGHVSKDLLDSLYRDMHTLKGTAQLFGFKHIGLVAHSIEASLEPVRQGKVVLDSRFIDLIYSCLDLIGRVLKKPELDLQNDLNLKQELSLLLPRLIEVAIGKFGGNHTLAHESQFLSIEGTVLGNDVNEITVEETKNLSTDSSSDDSSQTDHIPLIKMTEDKIVQQEAKPKREISDGISTQAQTISDKGGKKMEKAVPDEAQAEATTIRVQVSLLDKLMNLVGEMVLTRNQVLQYAKIHEEAELTKLTQRLDIVTTELQDNVMKTRMQPIGTVFSKFQRLVRDLAKDLGKNIDLQVFGAETELDKSLVEAIKDPLTHIVRNACDHGIEKIEARRKKNKNEQGKVVLKAYHEGGQIVIEISDDGGGLDPEKLKQKAMQKQILTKDKAATLSEKECFELIFLPGFSTAEQVTSVSGRGVGMDVVRTNVEKVGGTIEIDSKLDVGTSIRLRIPLTLAIVPAMIVSASQESFAIPQVKLQELLRVDVEEDRTKIEILQGQKFYRLRNSLLPLVSAGQVMFPKQKERDANVFNIVVLNAEPHSYGLIVDEIKDTADIVVKPLPNFLKREDLFSGATVMGDGSVSLIMDTQGVAQHAMLRKGNIEHVKQRNKEIQVESLSRSVEAEYLVFELNSKNIYALPLALVFRLEEFKISDIEYSGEEKYIKYRGTLLALIGVENVLDARTKKGDWGSESIHVIVVSKVNRYFGFVVRQIVDIVTSLNDITPPIRDRDGILGTIILENKQVLTIVDAYTIIDLAMGVPPQKKLKSKTKVKILLLEDTAFFVKQISRTLENQGHSVRHVENGEEGLKVLDSIKPGEIDLIVSDIEMPKMNGFDFAERVRGHEKFKSIPMVALTTRFRLDDQERGKKVGFNMYLEKLKPDELIEAIDQLMGAKI